MLASRLKRLSKDSLIYGVSGSLARGIGIIITFVYANGFPNGKDDYGIYGNVLNVGTLLLSVLTFGFDAAASIYYFDTKDEQRQRAILSAWLWFSLLLSLPACALLLFFSEPLSTFATNSPQYANLIALSIITLPVSLLNGIATNILRFKFRAVTYVILSGMATVLTVLLGLSLVLGLKLGLVGALVAPLISTGFVTAVGLWLTRSSFSLHLDRAVLGQMLRVAWPMLPASVAVAVNAYAGGLILIQFMRSQADVGVFSLATRVSSLAVLVVTAFQLAWSPYSLSIAGEQDAPRAYAKFLTYYAIAFGGFALAVGLFGREILYIIDRSGQNYAAGYPVVGLLTFGVAAGGANFIVATGSNIAKRTGRIGAASVIAACTNIMLNLALIPFFGIVGSAIASLAASLLTTVLIYFASQGHYPIPYEAGKVLAATALGISLMVAGQGIQLNAWWLNALVKLGILLLYVAVVLISGIITRREFGIVRGAVLRRIGRAM